jgi:hypothetical protein
MNSETLPGPLEAYGEAVGNLVLSLLAPLRRDDPAAYGELMAGLEARTMALRVDTLLRMGGGSRLRLYGTTMDDTETRLAEVVIPPAIFN